MEQINKVEILGTVGNCRVSEVGGRRQARVSVVTDVAFRNDRGEAVIESTWHNCILWGPEYGPDCFDDIRRGTRIHIVGRYRNNPYTDNAGRMTFVPEVLASEYQITDGANIKLQPQNI